jgi:hypothetical protein
MTGEAGRKRFDLVGIIRVIRVIRLNRDKIGAAERRPRMCPTKNTYTLFY